MQLYAKKQEFRMVKTICDSPISSKWRFSVLGKISPDHFHYEPTRAAISRIKAITRESHKLPAWEELLSDPVLSEDFREVLEDERAKPYKKRKSLESSFSTLEKYRRIRSLYYACKETIEGLSGDAIEIDELLLEHGNSVAKAHTNITDMEEQVLTFGEGKDESLQFAQDTLDKPAEVMLKTGYRQYDETNGGLPSSGVMLLASTTSGGKSVTSMNLLYQMWMLNCIDVCRVSLEMMKEQELKRFMARVSGIPFWKIKHNKLSDREKRTIMKAMKSINSNPHHKDPWVGKRKFKEHKKFTTITPQEGMTMEALLNMLKPYGFGTIAIDYVGLLDGMDGDRQWLMLSESVRLAKNFTKVTGSLVIILCQMSAEDKLRYSAGMKEHADVMWSWNYSSPEVRETKTLPVDVGKARDGELFQFPLDEAFEFMRVTSPKGEGGSADPRSSADYQVAEVTSSGRVLA